MYRLPRKALSRSVPHHSPLRSPGQLALTYAFWLVAGVTSQANAANGLDLQAVSNRADLISGGDVLVRAILPTGIAPTQAVLASNGQALANALHTASDGNGYLALVTGLAIGANNLTLSVPGNSVQLSVTNYPSGGPIFSGPHLQPWTCTTAAAGLGAPLDADCNAAPIYAFFYKNATNNQFTTYNPASPPPAAQILSATTDKGITVPYIVRVETGAINQGIYKVTVLFDPTQPWTPWSPQAGWNGKTAQMWSLGGGLQYSQSSLGNSFDDNSLSRGFATLSASTTQSNVNVDIQVNAETAMMLKEHVAETYGPIRYEMAQGCSGGSIEGHGVMDQYPGIIDGFVPQCSYPDMWSLYVNLHDCGAFTNYVTTSSPALWTNAADRIAVIGNTAEQECPGQDGPNTGLWKLFYVPTNTGCQIPAALLYDPVTNPTGLRCTLTEYFKNAIGKRPQDGFAYQVNDNVGVQYGLNALLSRKITTEQFVDMNEKIGGFDIDAAWHSGTRTVADLPGLQRPYKNGLITYGRELAKYPIIDARTDDNNEMHNNSEWMFTRNRILRTNGSFPNHIHWWEAQQGPVGAFPTAANQQKVFLLMDSWLARIEADKSSDPHEVKVTRAKSPGVFDSCFVNGLMYQWRPGSVCELTFTYTGLFRTVAGGPNTNDVLKCQLKPLSRSDYNVTFTDAQWARLQQTFASGVCDYSLPGVAQQAPTGPWLTYANGPDGVPLGSPPTAH